MEVAADQWRREWAGTAEYGKVVEGGVTRRVARAMEVLHASGPGARVRVMRAAYHSTAGPGLPASSFMLHSTRSVFSSGFNFLESPPTPSKPLEISSLPFESSIDSPTINDNYKVTEPDDFEISEPSKWRSSVSGTGSMRLPSEESSSIESVGSIIDLDLKSHRNVLRKYSNDSENSDFTNNGLTSRFSPQLDAPVTLNTLKFKSLLNGSNDWNSRRKSYSFEDTSPLVETALHGNETVAMESSTDSGICKSTEIVNDNPDDNLKRIDSKENAPESFQSWLSKNRNENKSYSSPKFKSRREHEDSHSHNIALQSSGKVTITLPIKVETEDGHHYQKNYLGEDGQRKTKKVEFCKTELHFVPDTGKVNIIATDEKPPPTNDFRKRRSAFVPMQDMAERPITLFGEKNNGPVEFSQSLHLTNASKEYESDENTAATKSILKNKIPKPKPYLLGENMTFGLEDDYKNDQGDSMSYVKSAVSLINRQLQEDKRRDMENETDLFKQHLTTEDRLRAVNQGPSRLERKEYELKDSKINKFVRIQEKEDRTSLRSTKPIKRSPTPARMKTRELRETDLTYFGVNNSTQYSEIKRKENFKNKPSIDDTYSNDLFQSVKLIKQISNSVCNSETEDVPEYINIPINPAFTPIPTPRTRTKFEDNADEIEPVNIFKPIIETSRIIKQDDIVTTRRSRHKKQDNSPANRSISEPRKNYYLNSAERSRRLFNETIRSDQKINKLENLGKVKTTTQLTPHKELSRSDDDAPLYENINTVHDVTHCIETDTKNHASAKRNAQHARENKKDGKKNSTPNSSLQRKTGEKIATKSKNENKVGDTVTKRTSEKKYVDVYQSNCHDTTTQASDKSKIKVSKRSDDTQSRNDDKKYSTDNKNEKRSKERNPSSKDTSKEVNSNTNSSHRYKQHTSEKKYKEFEGKEKRSTSKDKTENERLISMIETPTDKGIHDSKGRNSSKSRKNEYVINYNDKNGTVSSVRKIRSNSTSPRRKKNAKTAAVSEKETLKSRSSDKAALLQAEDHQWNITGNENKWKSKVFSERTCQVL